MKTKIGGFGVEFARSNYDPAVLSICKGRLVMFGCVDPSDTPVPSLASVVARVRRRLNISKQKSPARSRLRLDDHPVVFANAKARLLVDAAGELRIHLTTTCNDGIMTARHGIHT